MDALRICEEQQNYLLNQQTTLERLTAQNQAARNDMAKKKLMEKSSQFKTKRKESDQIHHINSPNQTSDFEVASSDISESSVENSSESGEKTDDSVSKNGMLKNIQNKLNEHAQANKSPGDAATLKSSAENYSADKLLAAQNRGRFSDNFVNERSPNFNRDTNISLNKENEQSNLNVPLSGVDATVQRDNEIRSISTPLPPFSTATTTHSSTVIVHPDVKRVQESEATSQPRPMSTNLVGSTGINYSDFEADTTPFDVAAIQSVNDLKELEQIFMTRNFSNYDSKQGSNFNAQAASSLLSQVEPLSHNKMSGIQANGLTGYSHVASNVYPNSQNPQMFYQNGLTHNYALHGNSSVNSNHSCLNSSLHAKNQSTSISHGNVDSRNHNFPIQTVNPVNQMSAFGSAHFNQNKVNAVTSSYQSGNFSAYLPFTRKFGQGSSMSSSDASTGAYNAAQSTIQASQKLHPVSMSSSTAIPAASSQFYHSQNTANSYASLNQSLNKNNENNFSSAVTSGPRSLSPRIDNPLNSATNNVHSHNPPVSHAQYLTNGATTPNYTSNNNTIVNATVTINGSLSMSQNNNDHVTFSSGMKSAKSLGDLTSLLVTSEAPPIPAYQSTFPEERRAGFNVYLPMSSYLAAKK